MTRIWHNTVWNSINSKNNKKNKTVNDILILLILYSIIIIHNDVMIVIRINVYKFAGLTFLDLETIEPFAISDPSTRRKRLSCKSNVYMLVG